MGGGGGGGGGLVWRRGRDGGWDHVLVGWGVFMFGWDVIIPEVEIHIEG